MRIVGLAVIVAVIATTAAMVAATTAPVGITVAVRGSEAQGLARELVLDDGLVAVRIVSALEPAQGPTVTVDASASVFVAACRGDGNIFDVDGAYGLNATSHATSSRWGVFVAKSDDDVRELHDRLAVRSATVVCNLECVWPDPVAHRPLPTALDAAASGPDGRVIDAGALGENITGKAEAVESIVKNAGDYYEFLRGLSGDTSVTVGGSNLLITTRYTYSSIISDAQSLFMEKFTSLGYTVTVQPFSVGSTTAYNVVATKTGTTSPSEIVVFGGHYDSTSQDPYTLAPGAVDNGSGAAGVLAVATAFADVAFERTVQFVVFSGEEQGLYGSKAFVAEAQKNGDNIVAALCNDMVAYSNKYFGVIIEGTTNSAILELMDVVYANTGIYAPSLSIKTTTKSFGSDHVPFQQAGIPAILAIERDDTDYPDYHRTGDSVKNVNTAQMADIMAGMAGALWDLANGVLSSTGKGREGARA